MNPSDYVYSKRYWTKNVILKELYAFFEDVNAYMPKGIRRLSRDQLFDAFFTMKGWAYTGDKRYRTYELDEDAIFRFLAGDPIYVTYGYRGIFRNGNGHGRITTRLYDTKEEAEARVREIDSSPVVSTRLTNHRNLALMFSDGEIAVVKARHLSLRITELGLNEDGDIRKIADRIQTHRAYERGETPGSTRESAEGPLTAPSGEPHDTGIHDVEGVKGEGDTEA